MASTDVSNGLVLLGDAERSANRWATNPHHRIVKPIERDNSIVPNIGDIIEFTRDGVQLSIIDYKNQGERYVDVSPAAHLNTDADLVGNLRAGTQAVVEDVVTAKDRFVDGVESVWIRIGPVEPRDRRRPPGR